MPVWSQLNTSSLSLASSNYNERHKPKLCPGFESHYSPCGVALIKRICPLPNKFDQCCLCMVTQANSMMMSSPSPGPEWKPPVLGMQHSWVIKSELWPFSCFQGWGWGGTWTHQPSPEGYPSLVQGTLRCQFLTTHTFVLDLRTKCKPYRSVQRLNYAAKRMELEMERVWGWGWAPGTLGPKNGPLVDSDPHIQCL